MEIIATLAAIVVAIWAWRRHRIRKRRSYLMSKYDDSSVVEKIMKKLIWQGMTEAQLLDSWGRPVAKDHRVYKSKSAETFKYNQVGKNRFGSRVKLESGIVVGWEQK